MGGYSKKKKEKQKKLKASKLKRRNKNNVLFADKLILSVENPNPTSPTKNLLVLIKEFTMVTGHKNKSRKMNCISTY